MTQQKKTIVIDFQKYLITTNQSFGQSYILFIYLFTYCFSDFGMIVKTSKLWHERHKWMYGNYVVTKTLWASLKHHSWDFKFFCWKVLNEFAEDMLFCFLKTKNLFSFVKLICIHNSCLSTRLISNKLWIKRLRSWHSFKCVNLWLLLHM